MKTILVPLFAASFAANAATNIWIAAADGNASDALNWSLERIPAATDDILLDGDISIAALTWNAGTDDLPDTVASWTQNAAYTNRVSIPTLLTGTFTNFTVTGDADLQGGSWWRSSEPNTSGNATNTRQTSWLRLTIGGNASLGPGFRLDGDNAGYFKSRGLGGNGQNDGASHGGQGGLNSGVYDTNTYGKGICYGSYREPMTHGTGGFNSNTDYGGGTIVLFVGGTLSMNGTATVGSNNNGTSGGAAGSIWIRANRMTGAGTLRANGGGSNSNNNKGGAGGGRIAVHILDPESSYATFTNDFTGTMTALGGTSLNAKKNQNFGAAGTVYVENAADRGEGRMFLVNRNRELASGSNLGSSYTYTVKGAAVIQSGVDCRLTSLDMSKDGRIGVASGGTLRVPTFSAITGDGSTYCALRFDNGGTVVSGKENDRLVPDGYNLDAFGENAFDYAIILNPPSTFSVEGTFTVPALKVGGRYLSVGEHPASECGELVSGGGVIRVLGLDFPSVLLIR